MSNLLIFEVKPIPVSPSKKKEIIKVIESLNDKDLLEHFSFRSSESASTRLYDEIPNLLEPVFDENEDGAEWLTAQKIKNLLSFEAPVEYVGRALSALGYPSKVKRINQYEVKKHYLCRKLK